MAETFTVIWEFHVAPTARSRFETIYGPEGDWAQLFRRSAEYRGTSLIRDLKQTGRYFTLDSWTSREALQAFKQKYAAEYAALDKKCESLTERESLVGEFSAVPSGSTVV